MYSRIRNLASRIECPTCNMALVMSMVAYIVLTPVDSILYIQWVNAMTNYKWLGGAVLFPLVGSLFFALPLVYYKTSGDPHSTDMRKKELFILALLDSLSTIVTALTVPYINLVLLVILGRMSLPLTMALSYKMLGRRYGWNHYTGVALTITGVFVAIIPFFYDGASTPNSTTNAGAVVAYMIGIVPSVLSYILKERYLKQRMGLNIWWMNSVISLGQFVIGLATVPLLFIPIPYTYLPPVEFPSYVANGMSCQFGGVNATKGDHCQYALMWLVFVQLITTISNALMFIILKWGSSLIYLVLSTLKTPITGFLGYVLMSYNLIYTTDAQKVSLHLTDFLSIVLIMGGSVVYNLHSEEDAPLMNLQEELLSAGESDVVVSEKSVEENSATQGGSFASLRRASATICGNGSSPVYE